MVANPNVFFGNEIKIVQGGLFYHHTADIDRFKQSERRENTGSSDIDLDIFQDCFDLFARIFISQGGTRILPTTPSDSAS